MAPQTYPNKNTTVGIAAMPGTAGIPNPLLPIVKVWMQNKTLPAAMPKSNYFKIAMGEGGSAGGKFAKMDPYNPGKELSDEAVPSVPTATGVGAAPNDAPGAAAAANEGAGGVVPAPKPSTDGGAPKAPTEGGMAGMDMSGHGDMSGHAGMDMGAPSPAPAGGMAGMDMSGHGGMDMGGHGGMDMGAPAATAAPEPAAPAATAAPSEAAPEPAATAAPEPAAPVVPAAPAAPKPAAPKPAAPKSPPKGKSPRGRGRPKPGGRPKNGGFPGFGSLFGARTNIVDDLGEMVDGDVSIEPQVAVSA